MPIEFSKKIHDSRREVKEKVGALFSWVKGVGVGAFKYFRANPRWFSAALLIFVGIYIGSWLEKKHAFLDIRYQAHQLTQEWGSKLKGDLYDHHTVLVLIGDDEYWKGNYEGRRPINKQHLAELISKLDQYNPRVIAVDFDFRSPMPDGSLVEYSRYAEETQKFAEVVKDVSSRTKVVLPKTLAYDGSSWITESETYDGKDLGNARFGYIALSQDYRIIPASVLLKDGSRLDSFSQAIVRAFDLTGRALQFDQQDGSPTYAGPYLYEDQFIQYSAEDVLTNPATQRELANRLLGKLVIIGGAWNRLAHGRGPRIDERYTPAGTMPAVFLHANLVESMLQQRTAKPVGKWVAVALEVILGFLGYFIFTYEKIRWYWKLIYALGVIPFWLAVAYVSTQNLGLFFDPFTPTLISLGKAGYEEVHEWRKDAKKYRELQQSKVRTKKEEIAHVAT